ARGWVFISMAARRRFATSFSNRCRRTSKGQFRAKENFMATSAPEKADKPVITITVTCPQTNTAITQSIQVKGTYSIQLMANGSDVICKFAIPGVTPNPTQTGSNAPSPWIVSFSNLPLHATNDITLTASLVAHGTTSPILASTTVTGLSITSTGTN